MLRSTASLKERLAGWTSWDLASFHLGACLGFWPDFGAPGDATGPFDPWHGCKGVIWSANPLGDAMAHFLIALNSAGVLEERDEPDIEYRWNPNYKGEADLMSILSDEEVFSRSSIGQSAVSKTEDAGPIPAEGANFQEELEKLVKQAFEAGHLAACWEDGGWPSNEEYHKSEEDLRTAVKEFLGKYNDKTPAHD